VSSKYLHLLADLGCALSDIDMLLKGEGTLKTLNTLLTMKQQEINQQVKQQQVIGDVDASFT
jgi:DNA-binding transcriptional MerR regulator